MQNVRHNPLPPPQFLKLGRRLLIPLSCGAVGIQESELGLRCSFVAFNRNHIEFFLTKHKKVTTTLSVKRHPQVMHGLYANHTFKH